MSEVERTIADLSAQDVGRRVTVETDEGEIISGILRAIEVETEWIEERMITEAEPKRVPGRRTVDLTVGRWSARDLPMSTPVRVGS